MRKTIATLSISLAATVLLAFLIINQRSEDKFDQYEDFLLAQYQDFSEKQHIAPEDVTPDKPEMAALQEYYKTLDPALGYVPKERAHRAYFETRAIMADQQLSRDYEPPVEWTSTDANMGGRTRALAFDPNDPDNLKVWAGGVTGGLWYTEDITDLDSEWIPIGDFWPNLAISCIAFDPNDPQTMYVGTGEGQTARILYRESSGLGVGIFKSTDGGESFELLSSTDGFKYITDMVVVDDEGSSVLYVGVVSGLYMGEEHLSEPSEGLYRSSDGGDDWEQVLPFIPGTIYDDVFCPSDIEVTGSGQIFVGTMENLNFEGGACVLYSETGDPGDWTVYDEYNETIKDNQTFNIPARTILASAPSNPDWVYAQFAAGFQDGWFINYSGIYMTRTKNGGETWSDRPTPNMQYWAPRAWHNFVLKVSPINEETIITGGVDLYKSSNSGQSWNQISAWSPWGGDYFVHADQHNIQFLPGSNSLAIMSNDGGVFISDNFNLTQPTFNVRNKSYNTLQYYTCAINPVSGTNQFLGGLQDNGTVLYDDSPLEYSDMVSGGDGAYCFFDKDNENVFISSYYYNGYTAWNNGYEVASFGYGSGTFVSPADFDSDDDILYSNAVTFTGSLANRLLRVKGIPFSIDDELINIGTSSNVPFSHIKYSPYSDAGKSTLFVATQSGKLYKITNAHSSPQAAEIGTDDFPTANISCVALGSSEDVLLVTFTNYGVTSVWLTIDGGDTWVEKESNLPDMPIRWAIIHPDNDGQAMLATETGIWATNTLMENTTEWAPAVDGMANVRVDMLQLRDSDNTVLAATHGRGFFTTEYVYDLYTAEDEHMLNAQHFQVYPNPASEFISIKSDVAIHSTSKIQISDMSGRMVKESYYSQAGTPLDISDLSKGVYLIHMDNGETVFSEKIIIR